MIGEPISAAAGVHIPHPGYWPMVREICDRYGVLLICDEVITGFGRTGRMFATEHWGIVPDITVAAKALTSGYVPIGAVIASRHVADAFTGPAGTAFDHRITFGGNPVSCAAGLANLDVIERELLVRNAADTGGYLFSRLQELYRYDEDRPVTEGIVRPGFSYCTFGYLLSASGLRKVLSCGFERALIPVDELLPALCMDHPREDIRLLYPKRLSAHALEPALITQLPKREAGSDTESSAFVVNKKASAERDRPVTALAKHMDAVWSSAETA
ncbi:aspartate aminotransferase family protein [Trebonia kvetii]|uniref:Aspartate aminotransferase family protein n=1 Tax=Trebonia kvetii TaxID=2480626 RepID=A0A6P2BXR5_9ACTN|nr:aminotransferase class III-fold pyridoxal phosphate-dependent enzyme [Trebonia kvetii]TVZ03864.1 aspartate aminotransferase family protein [Trebonia kvetii]